MKLPFARSQSSSSARSRRTSPRDVARRRRLRSFSSLERLESRRFMDANGDDLALLTDEFDDPTTLADWSEVNAAEGWGPAGAQFDAWHIDADGSGRMVLQPHTVVWYEDWRGPLVFKEVTGDFVITTRLRIMDRDDVGGSDLDDVPGDAQFSLGGLMIRTPRPITSGAADWQPGSHSDSGQVGENYVFLSMGYTTGENRFSFEVKTTRNSTSQLELTPLGLSPNEVELRIARVGSAVIVLHRLEGQTDWTVHRRYSRTDFPETLQVGMVAYTDWEKANDLPPLEHNGSVLAPGQIVDPSPGQPFSPDLTASFDYARFARPQVPAALADVDLVLAASDAQLLAFLGDAPADPNPAPPPVDEPLRVGMNLTGLIDWDPAHVFRDAFTRARPWGAQARNLDTGATSWQFSIGEGPALQVDDHGWVTELPIWQHSDGTQYQQQATTVLFTDEAAQPAGIYRAEWIGDGDLAMPYVIEMGTNPDGSRYALVDMPAGAHFDMTLRATDPANPVRDIRLWMPDYQGQSLIGEWSPGEAGSPFHPLFLERLQGFDTLRYMDWMNTNQTDVVSWDDRARLDDASQSDGDLTEFFPTHGVAPEYLVELANELDANPWFNMPYLANDDYVREFAELVRDTLEPERTIYVEWSNELWNAHFPTSNWLWQQTQLPENAGLDFFQLAGREMSRDFDIWSDVFAGQESRLVRVVAGQQANVWLTEQLVAAVDGRVDAISSTAYAGISFDMAASYDATTTADDILDDLVEVSIPWAAARLNEHRQLVEQFEQQLGRDLQFVTYESGSHIFSDPSPLPYSPALAAAQEAAASPRMYDVYQTLLGVVQDAGVDLYNEFTFTSHATARPFGTYGVLHDLATPLADAHKLRALLDFAGASSIDASPLVEVTLRAVDAAGQPLDAVEVGQPFYLVATVDDLRTDGQGVFSAYVDVAYPDALVELTGDVEFADAYPNQRSFSDATPGLLDETGAVGDLTPLGGAARMLFRVPLVATATGSFDWLGTTGDLLPDHEFTLYDAEEPIDAARVSFVSVPVEAHASATADDDQFAMFQGDGAASLDVLENDSAAAGDAAPWIESVSAATHGGAISIAADGSHVIYVPAAGFYGDESFTYVLRNAYGQSASAQATVSVHKRWHNSSLATDVTGDGHTSPIDALRIINILNRDGSHALPAVPTAGMTNWPLVDVNDDQFISPIDALLVINALNEGQGEGESGEGEFSPASNDAPVLVALPPIEPPLLAATSWYIVDETIAQAAATNDEQGILASDLAKLLSPRPQGARATSGRSPGTENDGMQSATDSALFENLFDRFDETFEQLLDVLAQAR